MRNVDLGAGGSLGLARGKGDEPLRVAFGPRVGGPVSPRREPGPVDGILFCAPGAVPSGAIQASFVRVVSGGEEYVRDGVSKGRREKVSGPTTKAAAVSRGA